MSIRQKTGLNLFGNCGRKAISVSEQVILKCDVQNRAISTILNSALER